jgi:hypothetical protein
MDEPLFFIQGMKFGKICSSIRVVESFIIYMGILNLSLEFFFVGGMKCGKIDHQKHYTIENHE